MTDALNNWNVQLAALIVIALIATGVFFAAEGLAGALPVAVVMCGFIALVHFGRRRSGTIEVLSGVGDERAQSLYVRAVAFAGTVMSFVLPGWWLVTLARDQPSDTLNALCVVFGASFLAAVLVLARRG
jgi:hypothetical protein